MRFPSRGELYWVFLDPAFGNELGGYKPRPVAVLSINDLNKRGLTAVVVPGTTRIPETARPNVVVVAPTRSNRLDAITAFQAQQVRALSPGRFTAPPFGILDPTSIARLELAIKSCLGLA